LWIGFTDEAQEGTWKWISGESVTFTNWNSGEPNNSNGNEDYAQLIKSTGLWNDARHLSSGIFGVIELSNRLHLAQAESHFDLALALTQITELEKDAQDWFGAQWRDLAFLYRIKSQIHQRLGQENEWHQCAMRAISLRDLHAGPNHSMTILWLGETALELFSRGRRQQALPLRDDFHARFMKIDGDWGFMEVMKLKLELEKF